MTLQLLLAEVTCNLTNMEEMLSRSVVVYILFLIFSIGSAEVKDFGFCKNVDCSEPISLGETVSHYNPGDADKVHFKMGQQVKIFSKDAGPKQDLLGVEVDGKKGYVPKHMVRETKKYNLKELVRAKRKFGATLNTSETLDSNSTENIGNQTYVSQPASPSSPTESEPSTVPQHIPSDATEEVSVSENGGGESSNIGHESESSSEKSPLTKSGDVERHDTSSSVDSKETASYPKSSQNDVQIQTSSESSTASVTNIPHSTKPLKDSGESAGSVSPEQDAGVSDFNSSSVANEPHNAIHPSSGVKDARSYSTKSSESGLSGSTESNIVLDSSISSVVAEKKYIPTEQVKDSRPEDLSSELSSITSKVTKELPRVVKTVVETFSESTLDKYQKKVQKDTGLSLQEIHEKNTATVRNELDETIALLEKSGYNSSDIAPDSDSGAEFSSRADFENTANSQSVETQNDSPQIPAHANFHGRKPYVRVIEENAENPQWSMHEGEKQDSGNEEVQYDSHQQTGSEREGVASLWKEHSDDGASRNKFSHEGTVSREMQDTVTNDKYTSTSNEYLSDSVGDTFGIDPSESGENSWTHFSDAELVSSESILPSSSDHSGALAESESYATAERIDHPSATEASFISRHLKSEIGSGTTEDEVKYENQDASLDSDSSSSFSVTGIINNTVEAVRSFTETVISCLPEPFQLYLSDLQTKGVPPRATVLTGVISIPTILLFIAIIYIRQSSKEKKLLAKLSSAEQKLFSTTTERDVLKEDMGKLQSQLNSVQSDLEQELKSASVIKKQLENSVNLNQSSSTELRAQLKDLQNQIDVKTTQASALQSALEHFKDTNAFLQRKLQEEENAVSTISVQLQEFEEEVRTLHKEKEDFIQNETNYKEKIDGLEQNCYQLLQDVDIWSARANELTKQLENETSCRQELEDTVQSKDSEIQSLQNIVQSFEEIKELRESGDADENTVEEKIKEMLDTSNVQIKLKKAQDERDTIVKSFESERHRVMELEVEILEAKSENEKLKLNYNHALQDKTEAQTKLDVLSNYFKDKEMQLQKELGVQEAVRQQKEEDASFAARRVNLIEEENASYRYQVATLKQEIEETERNYKNQVALQEKKAHENWLAARAAERKLEDIKQEAAQLRQRLTLLEREQENWLNSSRDEIVRPVPKRPGGPNGEIGTQDVNRSKDSSSGSIILPHEMIPPLRPPVMPLDRSLPPMRMQMMEPRGFPPPPPMDPYFDFPPPLPFPPQPWHARGPHPDPLHPLDRRTPSSYERGRMTPPLSRRHHSPTVSDRVDIGRRSASPKEVSSRGSHTSSPPHPLPHFHDIPPPPPPGSFDFRHQPPPPINSRYPPPPRREFLNQGPGLTRADSRNSDMITSTPRGAAHQLPPAQERRQQQQPPSSRV